MTAGTRRIAMRMRSMGWLVAAWALACALGDARGQAAPTEPSVKAAYVYKFLAYVEWPKSALPADVPLVIGVNGAEAVLAELQTLIAGRRINGHPIEARRLAESDALDGVHVVFVGRAATLAAWVEHLKARPVLLVSDAPRSLDVGSMLSLVLVDGRVRFEASPVAAERAGIRLSARLLAVADRVVTR